MLKYRNLAGDSGIQGYQMGTDYIVVRYTDGDTYLYDYLSTGREEVERMKVLASLGRGLSSFISRNVRQKYAKKY